MSRTTASTRVEATITVHVPMSFVRRGGRKLVLAPPGADAWVLPRARIDNTMIKALARAHCWKQRIESGEYGSISELARAEKINQSYLCRVLRLTLLAPDLVETILDGRQPPTLQLSALLKPFPVNWDEQRSRWGIGTRD
jgi:hypothetical protein